VGVGVEITGGAQVVVTLGDVSVDTCRCDGHRRRRLSEVFGNGDLPGELGEPAADVADYQVLGGEVGAAARGLVPPEMRDGIGVPDQTVARPIWRQDAAFSHLQRLLEDGGGPVHVFDPVGRWRGGEKVSADFGVQV
jgi:hypothetical protein